MDAWAETGRRATLRELLVNEGLAVHTARAACPGHAAWEYFGYGRRQYARIRDPAGAFRTVTSVTSTARCWSLALADPRRTAELLDRLLR